MLERKLGGKGESQFWLSSEEYIFCGDPSKKSSLTRAAKYDNIYIYISPFIIPHF